MSRGPFKPATAPTHRGRAAGPGAARARRATNVERAPFPIERGLQTNQQGKADLDLDPAWLSKTGVRGRVTVNKSAVRRVADEAVSALGIQPAPAVNNLASSATLADTIAKVNELLETLRSGGSVRQ